MTTDAGWFAARSALIAADYVFATFVFETDADPRETAAHLCQEQSTAQWKRVDVDEDFREKHGAKVVSLKVLRETDRPMFAPQGAPAGGRFFQVEAVLAHPHVNFGARFPNMLTTLLGEGTFYTPGISAIRLTALSMPDDFLAEFPGPQFGIEGLRELLGIRERPFFLGVVKPNVGLAPEDFARIAEQAWTGGLDLAKDDENLADTAYSSVAERSAMCGRARERAEKATGEKKMYVANITDEVDRIASLHDVAVGLGANAVMLNALPVGLSAARSLRARARVPMLAHFDMIAAMTRVPGFGVEPAVMTTLQRLAGFDIIVYPGLGPRMRTTNEEILSCARACIEPLGPIAPALPVPGGSSRPANLPALAGLLGGVDFGVVPGRAVFNHPAGPAAGARSFRQAWEAVRDGVALDEKARGSVELRQSLEAFGAAE